MKIIITLVAIIIVGIFTFKYITNQTPEIDEHTSEEVTKPKNQTNNFEKNQVPAEEDKAKKKNSHDNKPNQNRITDKSLSQEDKKLPDDDFEDDFEEDYSEPIEVEDFKEFLDSAYEELEEDEEIAIAIVMEMKKIIKAQPKLEEEAINFFKRCEQSKTLSDNVKSHCLGLLKERGF